MEDVQSPLFAMEEGGGLVCRRLAERLEEVCVDILNMGWVASR